MIYGCVINIPHLKMPTLVHLADEREASSIKSNGIKIGKYRHGIYCMPVLANFYLSHQWLRELKRSGVKTFVGVYFKMDSKVKVFAGRYNEAHRYIDLGEAIKEIQSIDNPLGYEIIVDRKIEAKEISKIKALPQNIGWRYVPGSNGRKPCSCNFCIKSSIKASRIRKKYEPEEDLISYKEILKKLHSEKDTDEIENLLWMVRRKKRRSNPAELLFLLDRQLTTLDQSVALTLKVFKHKATKPILIQLLDKKDQSTKEFAAFSLLELYGKDILETLTSFNNEAINTAINDWKENV